MDLGGFNWAVMTIVGPLLLAAVLLWLVLRNRKAKPGEIERTEDATREVYREEEVHRHDGDRGT